mgnify:CR=1 FL=1
MVTASSEPPSWDEVAPRLTVGLGTPRFRAGQALPVIGVAVAPHMRAYALHAGGLLDAGLATRWSKSFVEVVGQGITNLAGSPPELVREGRLLRMAALDGLAAARLLVPGFLAAAQEEVDGRVIFAIPDAETCLLTGGFDPESVAALFDAALAIWHESDAPLSPVVYTKTDDGDAFEPTRLDDQHPCRQRRARAETLLLASVYAEQRASLEGLEDGPDLAPLEVTTHETRGVVTASVALEGSPTLLPASEVVLLCPGAGSEPRLVELEDLAHRRLLVRVPDFDPPRYALVRFPTADELDALRLGGD